MLAACLIFIYDGAGYHITCIPCVGFLCLRPTDADTGNRLRPTDADTGNRLRPTDADTGNQHKEYT